MRTFTHLMLAATAAAVPAAALAQPAPGATPGHTWQSGGSVTVQHSGGFRPGVNWPHRRLGRGFVVHPYWYGPQFHINNWRAYGFGDPGPDRRWIRYYDDAYLIDRGGVIVDARQGLDWDEYGERWEVEDGVPAYYGRGEFQPGDEDYAWARSQGGQAYGAWQGDAPPAGVTYGYNPYEPSAAAPAYSYGAYGGYYTQPIIIETIETTRGGVTTVTEREIIGGVSRPIERRQAIPASCNCATPRPAPAAPPPPRTPPPRPMSGERG